MSNTVKEVLTDVKARLRSNNIETWSIDSELLMCKAMNMTRIRLVTHDTDEVSREQKEILELLVSQRMKFKPMQYILGVCEFMGLKFKVNENTLIPRPDTEILVEEVINEIKNNNYKTVLDIGTGSGAIAVSVAKYCPDVIVTAADISAKALETAKINALDNNVKNMDFVLSDVFENISGKFDVIVSNPPYIETDVINTLQSQVKDYEPLTALDGGSDGLFFYRKITTQKQYINKNGLLAFEIGYNQGSAVKELMAEQNLKNIRLINDLSGLNRVVTGKNL